MTAVTFSGPKRIPYPGGCVLEPAPYALEYLLKWPTDITVKGEVLKNQKVFPFIRALLADPGKYGLSAEEAAEARDLFVRLAGEALEQEGGQRQWLEKELARPE